MLAHPPARQIAKVAIACRCGGTVSQGIPHLPAFKAPMSPAKLHGSNTLLEGRNVAGIDLCAIQSYGGFQTPLPVLEDLNEEHSFLDMFEKILIAARGRLGKKPLLDEHGVELGTIGVLNCTATVQFEYGNAFREFVQYAAPTGAVFKHREFAQFTRSTIYRLAKLTERPMAWAARKSRAGFLQPSQNPIFARPPVIAGGGRFGDPTKAITGTIATANSPQRRSRESGNPWRVYARASAFAAMDARFGAQLRPPSATGPPRRPFFCPSGRRRSRPWLLHEHASGPGRGCASRARAATTALR
jgi:hypothetical protein